MQLVHFRQLIHWISRVQSSTQKEDVQKDLAKVNTDETNYLWLDFKHRKKESIPYLYKM